ncbi:TrmH family RNA methyltransferase [bacterium]|nr:TrmH family RNA methyltransferase [bacterium]
MTSDRRPFVRPSDRLTPGELRRQDRLPAFALLDNIRSVGNVGSIFRTADAANLAGLYLCGMTATPPRPDMEKTALGATGTVPWDYWLKPEDAIADLRDRGITVVALEQTPDAVPYDRFPFDFPTCFVVGHEVDGVSPAVLAQVDATVDITMAGAKKSLNVAVSFGLMAFAVRRRWLSGRESAP